MGNKNKYTKISAYLMLVIFMTGFLVPGNLAMAGQGGDAEIKQLSEKIKDKQGDIDGLRKKIAVYERNLTVERSKVNSLKNQIYILETQIKKKETEIKLNEQEIEETNLEIKKNEEEIAQTEKGIAVRQNKISGLLRQLYIQDQKTELEIIIMNKSISDFFNSIKRTEQLQSRINDNLVDLKDFRISLLESKDEMGKKKKELKKLQQELSERKGSLEDQQYAKQYVLGQTRNSEARYQSMVDDLKLEQTRINTEIMALEKAIRAKLTGNKSKLSDLGDVVFSWPVPSHIVTTTFHDPDYPFRYIFEHPAIDVRAKQGTPLRAAASGYVAKVRNGGKYGYSYIMLIHNDGLSTVYGHVSAIYVKPDQFVTQGEVIGATGGTPGTPGAGRLTTAAHLHFEIRLNGIPVNPLEYLP